MRGQETISTIVIAIRGQETISIALIETMMDVGLPIIFKLTLQIFLGGEHLFAQYFAFQNSTDHHDFFSIILLNDLTGFGTKLALNRTGVTRQTFIVFLIMDTKL
jgi:hypothetical protein